MNGDDGLREAIARRLCTSWAGRPGYWDDASEDDERAAFYSDADAVLRLPEVAALRAKAAAADRVRELAEELRAEVRRLVDASTARGSYDDGLKVGLGFGHDRIRRALDGDGS